MRRTNQEPEPTIRMSHLTRILLALSLLGSAGSRTVLADESISLMNNVIVANFSGNGKPDCANGLFWTFTFGGLTANGFLPGCCFTYNCDTACPTVFGVPMTPN